MPKSVAGDAEDRAAILEVIHRNRIGLWTHNFDLWASCFVQEPYLVRWGWWREGGIFIRVGWDAISSRARQAENPFSEDYAYKTTVEELRLEIRGDVAWGTFIQEYPGTEAENHVGPGTVHEMRIFERIGGEWKIALLAFLDGNGGREHDVLLRVRPDGEITWKSPATDAALADNDDIVVRNGRLRFRSAALNRKLDEALVWAAARDSGYMSAHGAVPIVVEAGEGLPVNIYWIIAEAGIIFFAIGNSGISDERLTMAGLIFGLSPAQKQVAGLVAEGLSLPEIAERMSITANTARTHLNRIYEKTGVRTQPALVRVLLSSAPSI